ncbi:MAG: 3-demethylubiquinone-9 3-methyltransferase [Planctomycetaceae bacterium]|nr:3-demethylubiquinone-9 3-methyltransferase [Planctomycetaceae bacterium]
MKHKVTPFLMFEGKAEEAMRFYVSLFKDAQIDQVVRYGAGEAGTEGTVMRADFTLAGQSVICIDSPVKHGFTFMPSISMFVDCTDEEEVGTLSNRLAEGGSVMMPLGDYGFSRKFAWVSDRYGVSWQLNLPHE